VFAFAVACAYLLYHWVPACTVVSNRSCVCCNTRGAKWGRRGF